jgi:N-acetylmuramoyl-L-alanine amidase
MLNRQRIPFLAAGHFFISAILFCVRNSFLLVAIILLASASVLTAISQSASSSLQTPAPTLPQQGQPATNVPPQQAAPPPNVPPQAAPPPPAHSGPVIVIDPAHGGTDTGARGESGVIEKDIVLLMARITRYALEREGFRVVMTRNDDSNPSYDDRAAIANAYRDVIFISFHISSTGTPNTARAYFYKFSETPPNASAITANASTLPITPSRPTSLLGWEEAQRPFADASHRLADVLQADLTLRFSGSPAGASGVAVRGLRSVAGPAVAIELSNVAVSDRNQLVEMAEPVATAVVHSITATRPSGGQSGIPGTR